MNNITVEQINGIWEFQEDLRISLIADRKLIMYNESKEAYLYVYNCEGDKDSYHFKLFNCDDINISGDNLSFERAIQYTSTSTGMNRNTLLNELMK